MNNPYQDNILKMMQSLSQVHSSWTVFSDFVELGAISISNSVDRLEFAPRKKRYLEIINRYQPNEQQQFPKMLGELVLALEREFVDILGPVFHKLKLHNHYKGQFFTPQYICHMMAAMMIGDSKNEIVKKGYISISEPTCGSGAMVLAAAKVMAEQGLNYQRQLYVEACDIDIKCVHMTYLQLSFCGIPAVVIHGNSLTLEAWSRWYTPMYVLGDWARKIRERT